MNSQQYRAGLLLVHGIQGNPGQFDFLMNAMPEDIYIQNLLLPGHGEDVRAFRKSGSDQWLAATQEAAAELRQRCEKVFFAGHSMGCLLGLLALEAHPNCFDGMLLLCCPFFIRPSWRYLKNSFLALQAKRSSNDPFIQAIRSANSVKAEKPIDYLTCLHPYIELLKLKRKARSAVPAGIPIHFFFSENDGIVSRKSVCFAREKYRANVQILKGCSHPYFTAEAKAELVHCLQDLLAIEG